MRNLLFSFIDISGMLGALLAQNNQGTAQQAQQGGSVYQAHSVPSNSAYALDYQKTYLLINFRPLILR